MGGAKPPQWRTSLVRQQANFSTSDILLPMGAISSAIVTGDSIILRELKVVVVVVAVRERDRRSSDSPKETRRAHKGK